MASKHTRYVTLMKAFGKAVRFYRNKLGFSQEALADRAQLDRSYMSQIERGIKNATLNSIWRISQALDVSPSALLTLTEEIDRAGDASGALVERLFSELVPPPGQGAPVASAKERGQDGAKVLVVDDDQDICSSLDELLRAAGFQTLQASCGFEAIRIVASEPVDAVVSDIRMANGNGLELLDAMRKHYPKVPVFFLTGYDDLTPEDAIARGATG